MESKHSVVFAEMLIRAAPAWQIFIMAVTLLSCSSARCLHHIFDLRYHWSHARYHRRPDLAPSRSRARRTARGPSSETVAPAMCYLGLPTGTPREIWAPVPALPYSSIWNRLYSSPRIFSGAVVSAAA